MRRSPPTRRNTPFGAGEAFLRQHVNYQSDECLIWPYRVNRLGYAHAVIGGVPKVASRWMCILAHGEPDALRTEAAHSCGNPSCVNPRHLRWASHRENMMDKNRHGTSNIGERNGKTVL